MAIVPPRLVNCMSVGRYILPSIFMMASTQLHAKSCNLPRDPDSKGTAAAAWNDYESGRLILTALRVSCEQIAEAGNVVAFAPGSRNEQNEPEDKQSSKARESGDISGTVTDQNGSIIPSAAIVLTGDAPADSRTVIANSNGFFEFHNLRPAAYRFTVSASGFSDWNSQVLHLGSGEFLMLDKIPLKVATNSASVTVTASSADIAAAQVHLAEKQRVLGFIPNFLVVYDHDPAPMTAKLKFNLAFRVAVDPVTFIGVAGFAAVKQAARTPNYVEGAKGYGQRAGALYADGFTDLMLGGAVLPSIFHQDPRYFYQGTGTKKSRALHALFSPFVCRGDNGRWQPNYSSLGGDLASSAISETYYPSSNRGVGLVFGNFLIGTGERMASSLAQEFLLRKLTPSAAKNEE